ncbi:MAG TPA: DUF72 domain-containing protein [Candidatus Binatia bacterium]|jgi:uncharacterized protein YecE (DUF72 family)|nr:DUF72 domain-containing protein [Candidatus Binatia bacterium]
MSPRIHIGTSGWHYKHWRGSFYDPDARAADMLRFYVQQFDTVEINNSFYRLPTKAALQNWRDVAPGKFCFAVKGSRFLTHMKKLKDPEPGLGRFFDRVETLGRKLGPILFQLPPGWQCNSERLASFLRALPPQRRYAFEFRNPTWHQEVIYELLRSHNAAFCIYELAGFQSPVQISADFAYVRLHGPDGAYQGKYTNKQLGGWAEQIRHWQRRLKNIYVYFDNDQNGYAACNALELKKMLE